MAKVLVVDDESGMRDVIQVALMRLGHEVVLAPNGERAYALACEYKPNLIVTDVNMPNWNGLELLRAVNNNPNLGGTTVVLITAAVTPTVAAAPAFAVLEKPFHLKEFEDLACAALARSVMSPRSSIAA